MILNGIGTKIPLKVGKIDIVESLKYDIDHTEYSPIYVHMHPATFLKTIARDVTVLPVFDRGSRALYRFYGAWVVPDPSMPEDDYEIGRTI